MSSLFVLTFLCRKHGFICNENTLHVNVTEVPCIFIKRKDEDFPSNLNFYLQSCAYPAPLDLNLKFLQVAPNFADIFAMANCPSRI